jgi:acetyl esterase
VTIQQRLALATKRVEGAVLRSVMALPEGVQRRLAGPPIVRDGQTLATDTQLMLRLQRIAREAGAETMPIPDGRLAVRHHSSLAGGVQSVGAVRDLPVGDPSTGSGHRLPGRLYVPTDAPARGPLLVFFHGGGWIYGDLDSHDASCRFLAEQSGVRILAVDYRLAPEHPFPAAYDDCLAAYRWVVANAGSIGADPARLAVGGDSAGGCLAATTAIAAAAEGLPLAFQLLVYPGTDHTAKTGSRETFADGFYLTRAFMDLATGSYLPDGTPLDDPRASPLHAELPAALAPAYVVTAGFDPLRDEGEAYARKLADAGFEVELKRFPDQIHGFFNVVGIGRTSRAAVGEIAARLRAALA